MTEEDVVGLLGQPAARFDFGFEQPPGGYGVGAMGPERGGRTSRVWLRGELLFYVEFKNGRAERKLVNTDLPLLRHIFPRLFGRNLL